MWLSACETIRCSARGYTDPTLVPKLKGGQETANQRLGDLGEKLYTLLTRNDDVQPEVREKIKELLDKTPLMKKRFDELAAANPVPKS